MRRKKNMIEHDIWVAAFIRALGRKGPNRAREIASDAVNTYRHWKCSVSYPGRVDLHEEKEQIAADFRKWATEDQASRANA